MSSFKNCLKSKNIPDEIRILKYVEKAGGRALLQRIIEELNVNVLEINRLITVPVGGTKYLQSDSCTEGDYREISVEGRFKLIEWENLQKTRRTARLSIFIAVMSVITATAATFFAWKDSGTDRVWQEEQIELLQEISQKLDKTVIPAEAGIYLDETTLDSGSSPE